MARQGAETRGGERCAWLRIGIVVTVGCVRHLRAELCVAVHAQPVQRFAIDPLSGAISTNSFESRRRMARLPHGLARRHPATCATRPGTHSYSHGQNPSQMDADENLGPGTAPIGATMFEMERLNHSRTRVYGNPCTRLPVDTSDPADKLKKSQNGFKFERFDVLLHFEGMLPAQPVRDGEPERSPTGFVRLTGLARTGASPPTHPRKPPGKQPRSSLPTSPYRLDRPNEFSRRQPLLPCFHGAVGWAAWALPASCAEDSRALGTGTPFVSPHPRRRKVRSSPGLFRSDPRDAAQALQCSGWKAGSCRGVQGGSITGWEDCSDSQHIAGRQSYEEMAQ